MAQALLLHCSQLERVVRDFVLRETTCFERETTGVDKRRKHMRIATRNALRQSHLVCEHIQKDIIATHTVVEQHVIHSNTLRERLRGLVHPLDVCRRRYELRLSIRG